MKHSFMIAPHRLEGFYRAAQAGGFARAARAYPYPITAPAVYQQVRKLEDELGVTLLQRVGKDRLALTSAGRVSANLGFSLLLWPDPKGPRDRQLDAIPLRGPGTRLPVTATYRANPIDPLVQAALTALTTRTPH